MRRLSQKANFKSKRVRGTQMHVWTCHLLVSRGLETTILGDKGTSDQPSKGSSSCGEARIRPISTNKVLAGGRNAQKLWEAGRVLELEGHPPYLTPI